MDIQEFAASQEFIVADAQPEGGADYAGVIYALYSTCLTIIRWNSFELIRTVEEGPHEFPSLRGEIS